MTVPGFRTALFEERGPDRDLRHRWDPHADPNGDYRRPQHVCLARDRLHIIPETWFTQLAFGESPDAVENV